MNRLPRPGPSLSAPDAAPVDLHDALADGQHQPGVPALVLTLNAGELPKQVERNEGSNALADPNRMSQRESSSLFRS